MLADAMEAVIELYIWMAVGCCQNLCIKPVEKYYSLSVSRKGHQDYKTRLQELLQSRSSLEITYRIVREEGPDHDKWFTAEVYHGGATIGRGQGKSKKEAEQQAACQALSKLNKK